MNGKLSAHVYYRMLVSLFVPLAQNYSHPAMTGIALYDERPIVVWRLENGAANKQRLQTLERFVLFFIPPNLCGLVLS